MTLEQCRNATSCVSSLNDKNRTALMAQTTRRKYASLQFKRRGPGDAKYCVSTSFFLANNSRKKGPCKCCRGLFILATEVLVEHHLHFHAAVFGTAGGGFVRSHRVVTTEVLGGNVLGWYALAHEVALHGLGPLLRQRQVVLRRAHIVGVAAQAQAELGLILQQLG